MSENSKGVERVGGADAVTAARDLHIAARQWLAHYDVFVRMDHLGDEPWIAEMRQAVAALDALEAERGS